MLRQLCLSNSLGSNSSLAFALFMTLLFPLSVAARDVDAGSTENRDCSAIRFGEGCFSVGFSAGYAIPFRFDDADTQVEDSAFVALLPRGAVGLTDSLGSGWYRGNIELGLEGHFLFQTTPQSGTAWGASLLVRYNFLANDRFVPFIEIGGGIIDLDFRLDSRADGFNFALQSSFGVQWLVWDRAAVTAQWRYHHISNGRITEPNVSVDNSLFLIGTTFFLD